MKRFILNIENGPTDCSICPFSYIGDDGFYACDAPSENTIGIDCNTYDLSTMEITEC